MPARSHMEIDTSCVENELRLYVYMRFKKTHKYNIASQKSITS